MAVSVIESCIHHHLGEYRHWDRRYKMICKENKGKYTAKTKHPCDEKHKEWLDTSMTRAKDVVMLWNRFIQTRPFDNGRLNLFWRNEMAFTWDKLASWQKDGRTAFQHWDEAMTGALSRWEKASAGNPMADLPLRLRVRSEGEGSVLDILTRRGWMMCHC